MQFVPSGCAKHCVAQPTEVAVVWFSDRGILRRICLARIPRSSRRRWIVELDKQAPVKVLQRCAKSREDGPSQPYGWGVCRSVLLCYCVPHCQVLALLDSPLYISFKYASLLWQYTACEMRFLNTKIHLLIYQWCGLVRTPLFVDMTSSAFDETYWPSMKRLPQAKENKRVSNFFTILYIPGTTGW